VVTLLLPELKDSFPTTDIAFPLYNAVVFRAKSVAKHFATALPGVKPGSNACNYYQHQNHCNEY
jgi:hypothetical protein